MPFLGRVAEAEYKIRNVAKVLPEVLPLGSHLETHLGTYLGGHFKARFRAILILVTPIISQIKFRNLCGKDLRILGKNNATAHLI